MKTLLSFALSLLCYAGLSAQPLTPDQKDMARTLRGARLSMEANKTILSAGETAQLTIAIFLSPHFNNLGEMDTDGRSIGLDEMAHMNDGSGVAAPYHTDNWKILQGGGNLDVISDGTANYRAPSAAPPDNIMVISVDMIPNGKGLPKVVLIKTLYFENGDNIFAFNVPASGISDVRYGQSTKGTGAGSIQTVTKIDPRAMAMMPEADKKRLQAAQDQVKQQLAGSRIDVVGLTSDANATYDSKYNVTILKFLNLRVDGRTGAMLAGHSTPVYQGLGNTVLFTFTGKLTVGTHAFNGAYNSFLFVNGTNAAKNCECSMKGNPKLQQLKCGGVLTITSIDDNYINGTISTQIWNNKTGQDQYFNQGQVYGVFKVRRSDL